MENLLRKNNQQNYVLNLHNFIVPNNRPDVIKRWFEQCGIWPTSHIDQTFPFAERENQINLMKVF